MSVDKPKWHLNFAGGRHDWPNLATAVGDQMIVLRPLSESEAESYSKATDAISSFVHAHWPVRVAEDNILEVQNFVHATQERFRNGQLREYTDEFHVQMNRHIMNFLSSASSFIAFTQRRHKRLFGRKSKECLELLDLISQTRSESFELRFALQLRNFAAHFSLPLGNLSFSASTGKNGEKVHSVVATFRTATLLEYGDWDVSLRNEILAAGDEIKVLPILIGAMHQLDRIQDLATSHLLPAAVPHAEFILRLNREVTHGVAHIVRSVQTKFDPPRRWKLSVSALFPERAEEILRQMAESNGAANRLSRPRPLKRSQ
jgi:hypothetical protein